MIEFIKKKWLLLIVIIILLIIIGGIVYDHIEEKKLEDSLTGIGKGAADFQNEIYSSKSHLDEFKYNNATEQVEYTPNNTSSTPSSNLPTDIDIMSYAQTVLKKELNNPKISYDYRDYTIVTTGKRYKIEGPVNEEPFWMIIEFVDETYSEYDLISLQVGNDIIYKK